jgi:hypothetical protein
MACICELVQTVGIKYNCAYRLHGECIMLSMPIQFAQFVSKLRLADIFQCALSVRTEKLLHADRWVGGNKNKNTRNVCMKALQHGTRQLHSICLQQMCVFPSARNCMIASHNKLKSNALQKKKETTKSSFSPAVWIDFCRFKNPPPPQHFSDNFSCIPKRCVYMASPLVTSPSPRE